jgi:WD40 repeat protein
MATGLWNGKILLTDDEYTELSRLEGHVNPVLDVAFNEDGTRLASISDDLTLRLWDVATGQEVLVIDERESFMYDVVFSKNGHELITGHRTKTLRVFDGSPLVGSQDSRSIVLRGHSGPITTVDYSPSGHQVISSGIDGTIRLWDALDGRQISDIPAGDKGTWNGQFNAGGQWITAWCSQQGRFFIKVWEAKPPHI